MGEASDTEQQLEIEMAEITEPTLPPPLSGGRRKKSSVWEHFTVEAVSGGSIRARCKLCKQTFAYSNGTKKSGTSHLKRHIALGICPEIRSQGLKIDGDDSDPPRRRYRTTLNDALFDQDVSCENLAKMIIIHEYPLHIVEQPAVVAFAQSLQHRFRMPSFDEIEGEIYSVYQNEKHNLMQVFGAMPGRISLTICLWTTSQTLGYLCLKGQFIDNDWKLHRRMLNFMMVSSPHSENARLSEWNMKAKLFTITLDNNSANLRDHLYNKNMLVLKGRLFVVRCYANMLNEVAQDLIASIHGITYNIRESVKFVKACEEKFAEIAHQLEIQGTKSLSLDISMQWDTTFHMMAAALEYKQAFAVLETCDDSYNDSPSPEDWRRAEVVCAYLKLLHDSASVTMAMADPTANMFFQEAWKIQLELTHAIVSEDVVVSSTASEMHEKFNEYWKDCSLVLAIAVVMDPRFKMKLIEFSFSKLYGEDAARYVKVVNDAIHELYQEYEDQGEEANNPMTIADGLIDFDVYVLESGVNQNAKTEIEQYLEETVMPRIQDFDILSWWKLNAPKYPALSKLARDVLAIPMSMADRESSIFSIGTGSRVLDEYRSSLHPETVEALFCAKDWLQYSPTEAPWNDLARMEF